VRERFDDFCSRVARPLLRLSALALILLVTATANPPLRADESAAARPQDGRESASRLLDGFVRYTLRDYARAREILEPLANEGNADAQQLVGSMYANGEGVPQDDVRAAHWFSLAAEQGKVDARFALGIMYRNGAGVPKDRALALIWLRRAADQQHADAVNALGELCMESFGTADHQEAAVWFERAALMGNGTAQYNLGVLFARGQGPAKPDTGLQVVRIVGRIGVGRATGHGVARACCDARTHDAVAGRGRKFVDARLGHAGALGALGSMVINEDLSLRESKPCSGSRRWRR
jgi:hypothetical protein